jgi:hypothetical protein
VSFQIGAHQDGVFALVEGGIGVQAHDACGHALDRPIVRIDEADWAGKAAALQIGQHGPARRGGAR